MEGDWNSSKAYVDRLPDISVMNKKKLDWLKRPNLANKSSSTNMVIGRVGQLFSLMTDLKILHHVTCS